MFIPSKIEQLIIDNKLTKKSFCEKVSISVQGLGQYFERSRSWFK